MKIYISGPITGMDNKNWEAFYSMEDSLKSIGYEVVNPLVVSSKLESMIIYPSWIQYMIVDIRALLDCDAIYHLKGWEESKGAMIEARIAMRIGLKLFFDYESVLKYDQRSIISKRYYWIELLKNMTDDNLGKFINSYDIKIEKLEDPEKSMNSYIRWCKELIRG